MAAMATEPSTWLTRSNFLKVRSKKDRHCRKLPSSIAARVTGMFSNTRVDAGGGAGSADMANGLVAAEEVESVGLAMTGSGSKRVGSKIKRIPYKRVELLKFCIDGVSVHIQLPKHAGHTHDLYLFSYNRQWRSLNTFTRGPN